jgi:peptidoglycan/LPS O-acetylase OafA/YrhL
MVAVTGGAPTDFGSALLQDTLAALSTEGLTGMLIGMLPFLYLDGRDIWKHSKRSWAVVYAMVVVVFFLVVAPKPTNWADLGDKYGPWALVLGGYAAVALLLYFGLHRSERRAAARARSAQTRSAEGHRIDA